MPRLEVKKYLTAFQFSGFHLCQDPPTIKEIEEQVLGANTSCIPALLLQFGKP